MTLLETSALVLIGLVFLIFIVILGVTIVDDFE